MEYVYFIQAGQLAYIKIGKSNDPHGRLSELQGGAFAKLHLRDVIECEAAHQVEGHFHSALEDCRESGEWFNVSLVKLRRLCDQLGYKRTPPSDILQAVEPPKREYAPSSSMVSSEAIYDYKNTIAIEACSLLLDWIEQEHSKGKIGTHEQ